MDKETPEAKGEPVPYFLQLPWRLTEHIPGVEPGSVISAIAGSVLLIVIVLSVTVLPTVIAYKLRARKERKRDAKERDAILDAYSEVPEEVVRAMSVRHGVAHARASLLDTFSSEWRDLMRVLPELLNDDVVEETRSRLESTWTPYRRHQFYIRYQLPLSTVMNPQRWEALFEGSYGLEETGAVPTIRGVGESDQGMYVIVSTAPGWTASEWDDMLPVLRVALDAPSVSVEITNATEVVISLNDRRLRTPYIPRREAPAEEPDTEVDAQNADTPTPS